MTSAPDRDVACPRCGYNLRGLTTPRCPECGFKFDFEQLQTGFLRENIPTRLDRCDPRQPHQVLLRSLYELARGVLRPRRLLTTLDVNGPLTPAWLMLVFGTLWLWLLTAAIVAVAIIIHTGSSPAASFKAALLVWGPRTLVPALVASLAVLTIALLPPAMRVAHPTPRQAARLGAFLLPACAAYGTIPMAVVLCIAPDFALALPYLWLLVPLIRVALAIVGAMRRAAPAGRVPAKGVGRRSFAVTYRLVFAVIAFLWPLTGELAKWLTPDSLDPPWWIYSL